MTVTPIRPAGRERSRWSTARNLMLCQKPNPASLPSSTPNRRAGGPAARAHSVSAATASLPYVLDGQPPQRGIRDYDRFYFDDSDPSWEAEDRVIQSAKTLFADLPVEVEVRIEARVHRWCANKFGVAGPEFSSSADAIDHFAATACCLGVRREADGSHTVHAPHGFADLLGFILRPNPILAPRAVYESKAQRWAELWFRLQVLPWPEPPVA